MYVGESVQEAIRRWLKVCPQGSLRKALLPLLDRHHGIHALRNPTGKKPAPRHLDPGLAVSSKAEMFMRNAYAARGSPSIADALEKRA